MVGLIKETKNTVLERLDKAINEKGADRMNVQEVGMLADVVKDLAEAEKSCMEAEYYAAVTEAMDEGSMGYDGMGYSRGGSQGGNGYGGRSEYVSSRSGYRGQPRDSQGQYTSRRGYRRSGYGHDDMMQEVRQMMETADPQEREKLKMQLRQMAEM